MKWPKPTENMCIYALLCPDTDEIRYIGQTKNGVVRLYQHYKDFKLNKSGKLIKVKSWIKSLKAQNKCFKVKYLDYATSLEELCQKEIYWINFYQKLNLLNHSLGGFRPAEKRYTLEQKENTSKTTKLAMARSDVKANFIKGIKNRIMPKIYKKWSEDSKKNVSNSKYHKSKKIKIIDSNGNIYESLVDCAKYFQVTKQAVHRTLNGKQKTLKGLTLKRII